MRAVWLFANRYAPGAVALTIICYWIGTQLINPAPFYAHYDPELPYLLSALGPFKGQGYVYVDHPGTPVELLGTLILTPIFILTGGQTQSLVTLILNQPLIFLMTARAGLTLMSALVAVLLFRWAALGGTGLDLARGLTAALAYFAVHPQGFLALVLWSHNSFAFPVGTLLLLFLLRATRTGQPPAWQVLWLLGFGTGVLTSVQLYFATWVIGAAVTLMCLNLLERRGWRQVVRAGVTIGITSLLGFVVATAPILKYYPHFALWVRELIFHQGHYGTGPEGIASIASLSQSMRQIWAGLPTLTITTGLLLVVIGVMVVTRRRSLERHPALWAVAIGLAVQVAVTLGLILKHPMQIYLLSVAAVIPILLVVTLRLMDLPRRPERLVTLSVCGLIVAGFALNFGQALETHQGQRQHLDLLAQDIQSQVDAQARTAGSSPEAVVVVWTYGVASPCLAWMFGDGYANRVFAAEIGAICPNQVEFNLWDRLIHTGQGWWEPEAFEWDIMIVSPDVFTLPPYAFLQDYGEAVSGDSGLIFIKPQPR